MNQTIQTNSFEKTQKVGEEFAQLLNGGDVLCLHGDLGAGKTTFMQGLAKGLGIKNRIISPTFIIVRKYEVDLSFRAKKDGVERSIHNISPITSLVLNDIKTLYHIDLYRTESEIDLKGLGISEILENKSAIIAVEWAEKMGNLLPKKRWELDFSFVSENERKIEIKKI